MVICENFYSTRQGPTNTTTRWIIPTCRNLCDQPSFFFQCVIIPTPGGEWVWVAIFVFTAESQPQARKVMLKFFLHYVKLINKGIHYRNADCTQLSPHMGEGII